MEGREGGEGQSLIEENREWWSGMGEWPGARKEGLYLNIMLGPSGSHGNAPADGAGLPTKPGSKSK